MGKLLKAASKGLVSLALWGGCLVLVFWLIGGDVDQLLVFQLLDYVSMPVAIIVLLSFVLWSALPRWRRLENDERILWSPNLPARLGSIAGSILSPAVILPSLALADGWLQGHDYLHLAGFAAVVAFVLGSAGLGLIEAVEAGVSVKVSAEGVQLGRRRIAWSRIEAIESGFASLKDGAVIVLADDRIALTPEDHGPTGRALVAAVQRFSPATVIREPSFQAEFGLAPG